MVFSGRESGNTSSLLAEVSHGKRRKEGKDTGLRCILYRACTGVSLITSNSLVTCDTTSRTGLRDNNCALRKFLACSPNRANAFHIKGNRF